MNGIQIVLLIGIVLIAVYFFARLHNSLLDILLLLVLVGTALIFVFFPDLTSTIAHRLGVGRGVDLVFYISIITFWFVIIKLYVRIRKLEKTITDIVRKDALNTNGR